MFVILNQGLLIVREGNLYRSAFLVITDVLVLSTFSANKGQQPAFVITVAGFTSHFISNFNGTAQCIAFSQNATAICKDSLNDFAMMVVIKVFTTS